MPSSATIADEKSQLLPLQFEIGSDFCEKDSIAAFNTLAADTTATVALQADGTGGLCLLTTDATDNNEVSIYSLEVLKIAENKPIRVIGRLKYTEANTDDANVLFGVLDAPTANSLLDNGAGPKASFDGAIFFKTDGTTRWSTRVSRGTTYTNKETETTAGGSYQSFLIEINPISSTEAEVTFWIDSSGGNAFKQCYEYNTVPQVPAIKHRMTYTSTTEIALACYAKAGGANSEVVYLDYFHAKQVR